jgi:uncharacterized membrane protein
MIPNLTIIVTVYVVIRLAAIALRQVPEVERKLATQVGMAVCCVLAIVVVLVCATNTLRAGNGLGSALDAVSPMTR